MGFRLASAAFIAVFATYLFLGGTGVTDRGNPEPRDAPYNLLARGLLSGHLYVAREVPPALAALQDPYDPQSNGVFRDDPRYRLHDFSYYRGRLYLYFGAAPALLVFLPWHLLTGGWLHHWAAVVLLCSAGVLVNLSLVGAVRRREFPRAPPWTAAACVLVLGFGSYAPLLAARADMWEIPIAMGYLSMSVALRCLWEALENPERPARWIALASAAVGVAFASRPTMLPGAAILLVPFLNAEVRASARAWAGAVLPLALCGAAVAAYNALRFGSPFEFGQHYQMSAGREGELHHFSASYLPENLRLYLFQGVDWSPLFPYAHEPAVGPLHARLPVNHGDVEHISGVLVHAPILWAALAVPALARARGLGRSLALVAVAAAWTSLSSLLFLGFYFGVCSRYQVEFAPALALLASVGVVAAEGSLAGRARLAARCAWVAALAFTCAFTTLYGIDRCATDHNLFGIECLMHGNPSAAEREFGTARGLAPGNPFSRLGESLILESQNREAEARSALESLVRDEPGYAMAHFALGNALAGEGRPAEALEQYRAAHRIDPEDAAIDRALAAAAGRR